MSVAGTPYWTAPEVINSDNYGPKADTYLVRYSITIIACGIGAYGMRVCV